MPFVKKRLVCLLIICLISSSVSAQEKVSNNAFANIALINKISFVDSKYDQPRFSCGFLIKYQSDTFAVTAKHLLKIIKSDKMKVLTFENFIKNWVLHPLEKENEQVITDRLLNENKSESLDKKDTYNEDWLLFSIKTNSSTVKPLELRTTPLLTGEKLYVIGWPRKIEAGDQRIYEFKYYKSIGNRLFLEDIIVPEQFGGLSGAPVVDNNGLVVGIVSGGGLDPDANKKYFAPCSLDGLINFLKSQRN